MIVIYRKGKRIYHKIRVLTCYSRRSANNCVGKDMTGEQYEKSNYLWNIRPSALWSC